MSENAKHTPGPWKYAEECPYGREIRDARGRWLATANNSHEAPDLFVSDSECLPNARLIAAAPDLLAELKQAVAMVGNTGATVDREWAQEWWARARAAIARAEGGGHA